MAKQDDYTRYTIRLPTPLYERVKEAAGEASVNSLVVDVLAEKFPAPLKLDLPLRDLVIHLLERTTERAPLRIKKYVKSIREQIEEEPDDIADELAKHVASQLAGLFEEALAEAPPDAPEE